MDSGPSYLGTSLDAIAVELTPRCAGLLKAFTEAYLGPWTAEDARWAEMTVLDRPDAPPVLERWANAIIEELRRG